MTSPAIDRTSHNPQDVVCPVCGATEHCVFVDGGAHSFDKKAFGSSRTTLRYGCILRCNRCGLGFSRERATESQLEGLYRDMDVSVYESQCKGRWRTAAKHFEILSYYRSKGTLLDVGCASGMFLELAAKAGWRIAGVEPSVRLFEIAQKRLGGKGQILHTTLQKADFQTPSFDAVTLWDVLEHVVEPVAFLEHCRSLLKRGGLLFANVPDLGSWPARLLGSRWPLLLPEHLNYFNDSSLRQVMERAGFEIVRLGRRPTSFSVEYVLYRVSQHGIPGSGLVRKLARATGLGKLVVPMYIGERLVIARTRGKTSTEARPC